MDCRHIILSFLCVTAVVACAKRDPFERELGLQSRLVELSAEGGLTPVMVFSNTSWKAKFVTPVDWASLDRLSGEGSSQVKFAFAGNYGRARKVSVAFEAGAAKDTLVMIQASGVPEPFISLNPSALTVAAEVTKGNVILDTNIGENFAEVKAAVSYPEGETEWLGNVSFTASSLEFTMTGNTGCIRHESNKSVIS